MIPNTIFVPATGSYNVSIVEEMDDGYLCVKSSPFVGGCREMFVRREHVLPNTKMKSAWRYNHDTEICGFEEPPEFIMKHPGLFERVGR